MQMLLLFSLSGSTINTTNQRLPDINMSIPQSCQLGVNVLEAASCRVNMPPFYVLTWHYIGLQKSVQNPPS